MRLGAAAPLSPTAPGQGAGLRDTHSSWVMSSSPSSSFGSWYRMMGKLHSDCICKDGATIMAGMDVPTPSDIPPRYHHHPKTPSAAPNHRTHSQR